MKKVTVIVRTFNVAWVLDQALLSLSKQRDVDIDLMIVDSGSTDETLQMITHYPHRFLEVEPGTYFPGKVLNNAVSKATTNLIVFINSDVVLLDPYAIKKLIEPLESAEVAATFGRQIVRPEADLLVKHDYDRAFPSKNKQPDWMHYSLPIAAMKKDIWEKLPFYIDAWGSEDTHWGVKVKKMGYKVVYVPEAIAMHSHNYTFKQLASRRRIEGEADVYIYPEQKLSISSFFKSFIGSFLREGFYYIKHKNILGLPYLLINRFVYAWHYYKGFKHAKSNYKTITFGNYQ